jgi:Hep_Hag.
VSGRSGHAEGYLTTSFGAYSHAEGTTTITSGNNSHAEGEFTITNGIGSHAEGVQTTSNGLYSHTEGFHTTSLADFSHAEGGNTKTDGQTSHAEGNYTIASGNSSHAEGYYTTTIGDYSHTSGQYNITNAPYSQILGGSGNTTNILAEGSVIIGASGVTATIPYTTYVGSLNIANIGPGTSTTNLGIDLNGNVISGRSVSFQTLTDAATIIWDYSLGSNTEVTITATRILSITNISDGDFWHNTCKTRWNWRVEFNFRWSGNSQSCKRWRRFYFINFKSKCRRYSFFCL